MSQGWTVETDQSTDANYRLSDLQVAMQEGAEKDANNKLTISMKHRFGLAIIAMGSKSVPSTRTYNISSVGAFSFAYDAANTTCYAIGKFDGAQPYRVGTSDIDGTSKYYYIVNLVKTTNSYTLKSAYGTKYNTTISNRQWSDITISTSSNAITMGSYRNITVLPNYKNLGILYSFTGTGQKYEVPLEGFKYQMECWGAEGGNSGVLIGGQGAYTKGDIVLGKNFVSTVYVYVGGKGGCNGVATPSGHMDILANPRTITNSRIRYNGGWNGGGKGGTDGDPRNTAVLSNGNIKGGQQAYNGTDAGGGGGATDIRLSLASSTLTEWYSLNSMNLRIMVAAGGGGATGTYPQSRDSKWHTYTNSCHGGGLIGYKGYCPDVTSTSYPYNTIGYSTYYVNGGTQTSGGTLQDYTTVGSNFSNRNAWSAGGASELEGSFGVGGSGNYNVDAWAGGGGGAGYYGGAGGVAYLKHYAGYSRNGAGGSSFIAGHTGCSSSVVYSSKNYSFTSTLMIDGYGLKWTTASTPTDNSTNRMTMPNPDSSSTTTAYGVAATGRLGNGCARITCLPYD